MSLLDDDGRQVGENAGSSDASFVLPWAQMACTQARTLSAALGDAFILVVS